MPNSLWLGGTSATAFLAWVPLAASLPVPSNPTSGTGGSLTLVSRTSGTPLAGSEPPYRAIAQAKSLRLLVLRGRD